MATQRNFDFISIQNMCVWSFYIEIYLPVPKSTINIRMLESTFLDIFKMHRSTEFTKCNKDTRVRWIRNYRDCYDELLNVHVNHEKKFHLDDPDALDITDSVFSRYHEHFLDNKKGFTHGVVNIY